MGSNACQSASRSRANGKGPGSPFRRSRNSNGTSEIRAMASILPPSRTAESFPLAQRMSGSHSPPRSPATWINRRTAVLRHPWREVLEFQCSLRKILIDKETNRRAALYRVRDWTLVRAHANRSRSRRPFDRGGKLSQKFYDEWSAGGLPMTPTSL